MANLCRVEAILQANIDGTPYTAKPLSRVEELLIEAGGSGTITDPDFDDFMERFEAQYEITPEEFDRMWNHTNG